ncbi:MAG: tRNA-dihydrouridine synthase family protein [Patescibacteria group bacterium]
MKNNLFKKQPLIALAPMAGITDSSFRLVCQQFGVDLVYSEMISASGVVYNQPQNVYDWQKKRWIKLNKSLELAKFRRKERPIILQLFGSQPEIMAQAAQILVQKFAPEGIDINMGCPAKKVTKQGEGSALLKNPALAGEIVKQVKKAVGKRVLVSVKTRLGWNDKQEILKLAPQLEKAGMDFLCLHGRTYKQGFSGEVDYQLIRKVKSLLGVPVLANGGIKTPEQAKQVLEITGVNGLAIGQGAWGTPWLFKQINDYLAVDSYDDLNWPEIKKIILKHASLVYKAKGESGIIESRNHWCHYVRGQKNAAELRQRLVQVETVEDIKNVIGK